MIQIESENTVKFDSNKIILGEHWVWVGRDMGVWTTKQGGSKKLPPLHFQELKAQIQYEMIRNHASCSPHDKCAEVRPCLLWPGAGCRVQWEQQTPGTGPLLALCKTLVSIEPAHQNYEEPVITYSAPLHIVTRLIVTCTFTWKTGANIRFMDLYLCESLYLRFVK